MFQVDTARCRWLAKFEWSRVISLSLSLCLSLSVCLSVCLPASLHLPPPSHVLLLLKYLILLCPGLCPSMYIQLYDSPPKYCFSSVYSQTTTTAATTTSSSLSHVPVRPKVKGAEAAAWAKLIIVKIYCYIYAVLYIARVCVCVCVCVCDLGESTTGNNISRLYDSIWWCTCTQLSPFFSLPASQLAFPSRRCRTVVITPTDCSMLRHLCFAFSA